MTLRRPPREWEEAHSGAVWVRRTTFGSSPSSLFRIARRHGEVVLERRLAYRRRTSAARTHSATAASSRRRSSSARRDMRRRPMQIPLSKAANAFAASSFRNIRRRLLRSTPGLADASRCHDSDTVGPSLALTIPHHRGTASTAREMWLCAATSTQRSPTRANACVCRSRRRKESRPDLISNSQVKSVTTTTSARSPVTGTTVSCMTPRTGAPTSRGASRVRALAICAALGTSVCSLCFAPR